MTCGGGGPAHGKPLARWLEPGVSLLKFHGLDFGQEAGGVAAEERCHDTEHGVAEAADVQDVFPLRSL
jgi:hypothetical protein